MKPPPLVVTLFSILVAAPALAVPIGPGAFGPGAVEESFEGFTPDDATNTGALSPPVPFTFDSGLILSGPTNQLINILIHNVGPLGIGANGVINVPADVPDGRAFIYQALPPSLGVMEFSVPQDALRIGAYVTGPPGSIALEAYDANGALLETTQIAAVDVSLWPTNFVGLENAAGIRSIVVRGEGTVVDQVTFEALAAGVPEPTAALLFAAGALVLRRRSGSSSGRRTLSSSETRTS